MMIPPTNPLTDVAKAHIDGSTLARKAIQASPSQNQLKTGDDVPCLSSNKPILSEKGLITYDSIFDVSHLAAVPKAKTSEEEADSSSPQVCGLKLEPAIERKRSLPPALPETESDKQAREQLAAYFLKHPPA